MLTNPLSAVEGPLLMGDPFVRRYEPGVSPTYLLTGTTDAGRGFRAWRSDDLVNWRPIGFLYEREDSSSPRRMLWAPELFRFRDRYYLAFSAQARRPKPGEEPGFRLYLAGADQPDGPYGLIASPWIDTGYAVIDAHVFIASDGTPYLYFARIGPTRDDGKLTASIWGVELSADLRTRVGEPVEMVHAEQAWELHPDSKSVCNEGPFVFEEGGRYYMTFSAGHWAEPYYAIGYAVADTPLGPWRKPDNNPLLATDLSRGVSGPGHCSITRSPGGDEIWMVYHAHQDPDRPRGPRTVNLDRVTVQDGRLVVTGPTRDAQPAPR